MPLRECNECALCKLREGRCLIFDADMIGEHGCPYFATEVRHCGICGALIPRGGVFFAEDEKHHLVCEKCAAAPPCVSCERNQACVWQTDRNCPEPMYVMIQQRQGNMIMQTQQLNMKRVKILCPDCKCYREDDEVFCWRMTDCGCDNHKTNWRK